MKKSLLILLTICFCTAVKAQSKPKCDTLTESQVVTISQLLQFGELAAGNSDKISTSQYNQYHAQVAKIDSVLRVIYLKWHPVKEQAKKGEKQ